MPSFQTKLENLLAKLKLLSSAKPLELELFFDNQKTGERERQTVSLRAYDTLYLEDAVTSRGGLPAIVIHYDPSKPVTITLNVDRKGQCDDPDKA